MNFSISFFLQKIYTPLSFSDDLDFEDGSVSSIILI